MTFVGMDLPEAKTPAAALGRTSGQWRSGSRQVDAALSRTRWLGHDAAAFKRAWAGHRVRNDDRVPGLGTENGGGSDLDNDWAGRAILERYLRGGDTWTIENDPTWTSYLQDNPSLTSQVARLTDEQARAAVQAYLRTGDATGSFATTTSVAIANGEGIVGYQYLHGTNADAGGFKHEGATTVTPLPDGTYRVTVDASYQWNDVIDPNPAVLHRPAQEPDR